MIISSFATIALLLFSLSLTYVSHHICLVLAATPPFNHILPISLNSLDLASFEIAESSWLTDSTKTVAGADDASAGDASMRTLVVTMFRFLISSGAQLGRSGI